MVGRRTSEVLLEYKTDRSSLADTERAAQAVKEGQLDIAKANEAVAASSDDVTKATKSLTKAQKDQITNTKDLADANRAFARTQEDTVNNARQATEQLDKEAQAAANLSAKLGGAGGGGAGDIVGRGDTLVSSFATLGSTLDFAGAEALGATGDILGVADAVGGFASQLGGLSLGPLAAVGIGVGALGLGLQALTSQLEAAKQRTRDFLEEIESVASILVTGTTDAVQQAIEQLNTDIEEQVLKARLALAEAGAFEVDPEMAESLVQAVASGNRKAIDQALAEFSNVDFPRFQEFRNSIRGLGFDFGELLGDFRDSADEIAGLQRQINVLGSDVAQAEIASNDLVEATRQRIESEETLTSAKERTKAATHEDTKALNENAQAREVSVKQLQDSRRALEERIDTERKLTQQIQDDLRRAAETRQKLELDLQRKLEDIDRKSAERRAELESKFGEIDASAASERIRAVEKFNRDIEKIREEQRKAERRAAFSHARSLQDAILSRNFDAFIAEQQRYAEEQSNRDDGEKARVEALQDEIRAIEERRKEQIDGNRKALQDLQKQIADERNEANRAAAERLADQQRAEAEQRQARLSAFNQQLADLQNQLAQETQLKKDAGSTILNDAKRIVAAASGGAMTTRVETKSQEFIGKGLPVITGGQFGSSMSNTFNAPLSANFSFGTASQPNFAKAFNQMLDTQARQRQTLARDVSRKVR